MTNQSGQSLIEFLIVVSMGLFIIAGAYKLVMLGKEAYRYQFEQTQLMQEQEALELMLQRAVMTTGLAACGQAASLLAYKNLAQDQAGRVRIAEGTAIQAFTFDSPEVQALELDKPGSGQAVKDTDVLVLRAAGAQSDTLQQRVEPDSQSIELDRKKIFKPGQIIVISDCDHLITDLVTEVYQRNYKQELELKKPVGFAFEKGAVVSRYEFEAFYVGKTLRENAKGKTITALYVQDTQGVRHELVPDVSSIYMLAWIKPFQKQGYYQAIEGVKDWSELKGLKLLVQIKAPDQAADNRFPLMLSWSST